MPDHAQVEALIHEGACVRQQLGLCSPRDLPLPMSPAAPSYADDTARDHPRVLLVDDDEVTLMVVGAALRERGFDVREVNSGQQALQRWPMACPTSSCSTP
jgi:hypothetical protein